MKQYVLDTNSVIYGINRQLDFQPFMHHLSIITEMELLAFPNLSLSQEQQLKCLFDVFCIHNISESIKQQAIEIRKIHRLKLPDSIILATAVVKDLPIVTSDKKLLKIAGVRGFRLNDVSL